MSRSLGALGALGGRRALPEFRADGNAPHVDVGGHEVLSQPVALTGEHGEPRGLVEVDGSGSGVAVPRREVGTHEVQQPERLGTEGVAVPDGGQLLRIIERAVQHVHRAAPAAGARH